MPAFDTIAATYDLLTDWGKRLDREIPFLHRVLERAGARSVFDAACGTGTHLRALAQLGFEVAGSDLSPEMVARARDRLRDVPEAEVFVADFAETARLTRPRDAVLVLGNSLPNAGGVDEVRRALEGLAGGVRPGGILVVHTLNYARLLREGGGLRPLRQVVHDGTEHLFLKLFEVHRDHVALNVIEVVREGDEHSQRLTRSRLHPLTLPWLTGALEEVGLEVVETCGSFSGEPYDVESSGDILVVAHRTGGGDGG
jgi:SAM-dependent methyltransferase